MPPKSKTMRLARAMKGVANRGTQKLVRGNQSKKKKTMWAQIPSSNPIFCFLLNSPNPYLKF